MKAVLNGIPILVNARFLTQPVTGVQRYAIEISLQIKKHYPEIEFIAPKGIQDEQLARHLNVKQIGRFRGALWEQLELAGYARKSGGILLNLCNTAPMRYDKNALVIHDLAFHFVPESMHLSFRIWYRFLIPRLVRQAKYLFAISDTVRNEISRVFETGRKIEIAYNGIRNLLIPVRSSFQSPGPYILHVGSFNRRKNIRNLIKAFLSESQLFLNYKLVFIGAKSSRLTADIPEDHSSILVHSSCSDAELAEWYQHASCVVSLSEYEGFNLPVAEAISMGCRVVCSDIPVHRELYADRVDFCHPFNLSEISGTLLRCLQNGKQEENINWPDFLSYSFSAQKIISTIGKNEN